jgi:hypothetical protein
MGSSRVNKAIKHMDEPTRHVASVGNCGECRFWEEEGLDSFMGCCLRFPPTVNTQGESVWPVAEWGDGCGEFQSGGSERKDFD